MEELRRDLRIKSQELEVKNAAANDKLKKMVKDQQEAEKKKVLPSRQEPGPGPGPGQAGAGLPSLRRVGSAGRDGLQGLTGQGCLGRGEGRCAGTTQRLTRS